MTSHENSDRTADPDSTAARRAAEDLLDQLERQRVLINPSADRVRDVAALAQPRGRKKQGLFLVEGPQGVREALLEHLEAPLLDAVYLTEDAALRHPDVAALVGRALGTRAGGAPAHRKVFVRLVTEEVLAAMSDAQTPQGMLALAHTDTLLGQWHGFRPTAKHPAARLVAAMVRVQDPGNAGTLVRAADAAGADQAVATAGSVDLLNPKTVRSTAGSLFHLPLARFLETTDLVDAARAAGMQVLAADGHGDHDLDDLSDAAAAARAAGDSTDPAAFAAGAVDLRRPTLWLFGNEAQGLDDAEKALADARVAVPVHGRAESLNVGTAATLCLYASARAQRA